MTRITLAGLMLLISSSLAGQQDEADLLIVNARIYTVDDTRPVAQAMAVRDDRVLFVGSRRGAEALAGPQTIRHDLAGRVADGFSRVLRPGGVLVVGAHEDVSGDRFLPDADCASVLRVATR